VRAPGLLALFVATTARADEPEPRLTAEEPPASVFLGAQGHAYLFEAALRSGYVTPPIRGGVNPFGAGVGARLGFDVWRLYLGASFMSYLGGSDGGATDTSLLAGVALGYNGRIGQHVTLRPEVGVGDTILSHTEPATATTADVVTSASGSSSGGGTGGVTTTVKNVYVTPALTLLVSYGRFFLALDGGLLVVPGILYGPAPAEETTWLSYTLHGQVGFRL
jgi:hypothetical protein